LLFHNFEFSRGNSNWSLTIYSSIRDANSKIVQQRTNNIETKQL